MAKRPRLPNDYDLPWVGDWSLALEAPTNGYVWQSDAGTEWVKVRDVHDKMLVVVEDTRVDGSGGRQDIARVGYERPERLAELLANREEAAVEAIKDHAVPWMQATDPADWSHPDVSEAVFAEPPGYELAKYFVEDRTVTIYYRHADRDADLIASRRGPEEYTPETCPYLYVHVWRGSGKATVALAPWLYAHGPGDKHWEVEPILETPEECGLDLALTMAREWTREYVVADQDGPMPGQSSLSAYEPSVATDGGDES